MTLFAVSGGDLEAMVVINLTNLTFTSNILVVVDDDGRCL